MKYQALIFIFVFVVGIFGKLNLKPIPGNGIKSDQVCEYALASQADCNNLQIPTSCTNYCSSYFGMNTDACYCNAQGDTSGFNACVQALPNLVQYSNLQPTSADKVMISDTYYEGNQNGGSKTWTESSAQQETLTVSSTSTVGFQESISYTVKVPFVFSSTFGVDFSFSSTQMTSQTHSNTITFSDTTTEATKYNCTYNYSLDSSEQLYSSNWQIPICVTGYTRCDFPSPVADPNDPSQGSHYYWYIPVGVYMPFKGLCQYQEGTLQSTMFSSNCTSCVTSNCGSKSCQFDTGVTGNSGS
eukprot:TRINITY_DN336_c2_g1_i1.p1 TRINITY_DN336_c2_g1~~TRINITY_DN336_c2_g1_i1.p1  ORF type:complete len:300 (+),score=73.57 TRINITY_DN336_c2_g1_i1:101-1000(+)